MRLALPLVLPLALLLALPLAGCVEVEERLAFEREGNGTYALTLRWDADLLARVRDVVGEKALAAFEGRSFPLNVASLRDGLAPLPGVRIERLEESDGEAGWRTIRLEVRFDALDDLLRWEPLAARPVRIGPARLERQGRWVMRPLERLPVLDPLREAFEAYQGPRIEPVPGEELRDPTPWARLGWDEARRLQLARWLEPALSRVRLTFELAPAGRVLGATPRPSVQEDGRALFTWTWADLRAGASREIELTFQPGEFDRIPTVERVGDAGGPAGDPAVPPAADPSGR